MSALILFVKHISECIFTQTSSKTLIHKTFSYPLNCIMYAYSKFFQNINSQNILFSPIKFLNRYLLKLLLKYLFTKYSFSSLNFRMYISELDYSTYLLHCMYVCASIYLSGWVDGWMDGQTDRTNRRTDGLDGMDRWTDRQVGKYSKQLS